MKIDKWSGSTTSGLLKKISHYEFLSTFYPLKNILPSLIGFSKMFQTGSLNFSRILPVINTCKSKVLEVANDYGVIQQDLNGILKELHFVSKESGEIRVTNWMENMQNQCAAIFNQGFLKNMQNSRAFYILNSPFWIFWYWVLTNVIITFTLRVWKNEISFFNRLIFPRKICRDFYDRLEKSLNWLT